MRLKQVFIPLRISKGLLCLIAMFVMLLAPQVAWAQTDYGLTVAGVSVTSDNASAITGTFITSSAGSVSYDNDAKVLTLNNATIEGSIVRKNNDDLTIHFIGSNTINTSSSAAIFVNDVSIPSATLSFTQSGDDVSLTVNGMSDADDMTLGWATAPKIWKACSETHTYPADQCDWLTTMCSDYIVLAPNYKYDLWVNGSQMCDAQSVIDFDDESSIYFNRVNVLTLNGISISNREQSPFIKNGLADLIIKLEGENSVDCGQLFLDKKANDSNHNVVFMSDNPTTSSLVITTTGDKNDAWYSGHNNPTCNNGLTINDDKTGTVCKITISKPTSYDLTVGGVTVTSGNASDVLEDGKVSYDNDSHTLTLNNASIDFTENERSCIVYTGSDDLIIKLIGTNSIKVTSGCEAILYDGSGNNPKLYFDYGSQSCSLMLQGEDGSVIKNFASIKGVNDIGGDTGNYLMLSGLEAKYDVENGLYTGESTNPTPVTTATITSGYGLTVGDVLVYEGNAADIFDGDETNDGKVSYNFSNNKLALNGAKLSGESISYVGTEDLTIELNGNSQVFSINCVNDNADEKPQLLFTKADGVTSCSLTLDSRGDGSVIDGFSAVDFGTFNTMSSVPLRYGKIDPDENYVCLLDAVTNDFASDVTITTATTYPIWVKGNQVTADNADDLFNDGTDDKDPSVSFTPAVDEPAMPATLTLNGVNYSLNDGDTTPLVVSGLDNLTVKLVGSSSVYTSDQAEVYPDAAFVSTNSEAVLTFTTDESTRLQPLNTNSIELASGFKSIAFTGYLYREQNMVKNLLAPTPGMDGKFFTVNRAGYEPDETTFNYVIEYTDNTQSVTGTYDMSKTATENNIVLDKPCTVTVYAQYGTLKSAEKVGKLFGFEGGNELNTVYGTTQVAMPTLVPAIAEADGITIAKEGNFVDNDKTIINLSGKTIGKASTTIIASLTASNDTPYTLLNSSVSLNVNILPPAPTIEFDAEKTYLNSDKVSISLPESLVEDENASIKYSWVADCEPGNGNNYDNESKVELNAGTHTLYAWVRYNGATADDAVYSERVSQEFTAKTDINQFAVKDLLDNTTFTYTGTAIVPTFTLYDAMDESNTLSTDDYDVRIEKFVDQATGYSVVDDIVDAGKYMVYAVGKGTTYGGEKIIYEGLNVEKANLTLTVSDDDLTYNGKDQPLITINNVPTGATVKYYCRQIDEEDYDDESFNILCEPSDDDFSDDVPNGKNVGYFALIYKVDGGKNYKSQDAGATIKIAILPAEITELKLSATELPYNGENQAPSIASVKAGDDLTLTTYDYTISYEKITGDETTTEINASEVKAVGSYNVVVTGQGNFTGTAKAPFAIVDRTLAVGAEGDVQFGSGQNWATYYTETEDLLLPDNIAAYVVTGVDGSTVTTQRISKVMSNVPVLLQQYTTAPAAEINDDVVVSPFWKGTTEATNVSDLLESRVVGGAVYVLYNNAFVKSKSGAILANRGYLLFGEQAVAPRLTIELPGGTTGVSDVRSKKADVRGDFYDLQGRKVQKPSKKGLYINEGHKVVVK